MVTNETPYQPVQRCIAARLIDIVALRLGPGRSARLPPPVSSATTDVARTSVSVPPPGESAFSPRHGTETEV